LIVTAASDNTAPDYAAPDYVEPLVGWRLWLVGETPFGMRLRSVFPETEWQPCQAVRAACLARHALRISWPFTHRAGRHAAPDTNCTCGLYAARPEWLLKHLNDHEARYVIGRVMLWGEVVECEQGWRGACAYPAHLYVPRLATDDGPAAVQKRAHALEVYGVPVEQTSDVALELLAAA
jgi:hypothetical protein